MKISERIKYIGVNDHNIDLFEGQYVVANGISYNSYVILDEKVAVFDTVDQEFTNEWLYNLEKELNGRSVDYLIIQHMEPDHSANIINFINKYKDVKIVSSAKAFQMMNNFFGNEFENNRIVVGEGDKLSLGHHKLVFITAPMVHWPEVIMTYDETEKILFSADAFGKFGALDHEEEWDDEARRYYIGIVGKYGPQVQNVLKKAGTLDIKMICPLHGPVLNENLSHYINLYDIWSKYDVEEDGIVVAYTSMYGNTKKAVIKFVDELKKNNHPNVVLYDLARCDMSKAVSDAFRYGKLVLATTTYNMDIFPFMKEFINHLVGRNYQNRTIAFIENGSWAPNATNVMKGMFANCKNITYTESTVRILSSLNEESSKQLDELVKELCAPYQLEVSSSEDNIVTNDFKALSNIGYGLYVVTTNDGVKDNGIIVNTVTQVTNTPNRVAVTINKGNYSHDVVIKTNKMNVNTLTVETPFKVFEVFGFQSGRDVNKFEGCNPRRSTNGLVVLPKFINSYISLEVIKVIDLETHSMFICDVVESVVISNKESMSYNYYLDNVKPKTDLNGKKGYVCTVCGWVYEGSELPDDIICPLCKHGAADFEEII